MTRLYIIFRITAVVVANLPRYTLYAPEYIIEVPRLRDTENVIALRTD